MLGEIWAQDLAEKFWIRAGVKRDVFPRELEPAVYLALPIALVKLSDLWITEVKKWLAQHDLSIQLNVADRALHGCSFAYCGQAVIFIDGTDSSEWQRFTIAHETAHLILDYFEPRKCILNKMGPDIMTVLDGFRLPDVEERVECTLAHVTIGVHQHLMNRDIQKDEVSMQIEVREARADQLALELLAPWFEVTSRITSLDGYASYDGAVQDLTTMLYVEFGLPSDVASHYAPSACRQIYNGPSVAEWLGF